MVTPPSGKEKRARIPAPLSDDSVFLVLVFVLFAVELELEEFAAGRTLGGSLVQILFRQGDVRAALGTGRFELQFVVVLVVIVVTAAVIIVAAALVVVVIVVVQIAENDVFSGDALCRDALSECVQGKCA